MPRTLPEARMQLLARSIGELKGKHIGPIRNMEDFGYMGDRRFDPIERIAGCMVVENRFGHTGERGEFSEEQVSVCRMLPYRFGFEVDHAIDLFGPVRPDIVEQRDQKRIAAIFRPERTIEVEHRVNVHRHT